MKKKNIFKRMKQLALIMPIFATLVLSSCYTDYGLDPNTNYDVVITLYNKDYNFAEVQNYYLEPTVRSLDGGATTQYNSTIISTMQANLNALGWNQLPDSLSAATTPHSVYVAAGEFTNTTTEVSCGYGGYYDWYYPPYYCGYSYTYTTGTITMFIGDLNNQTEGKTVLQWNGTMNGLTNSSGGSTGGTPQTRITNGVNQAFTQSPYLK